MSTGSARSTFRASKRRLLVALNCNWNCGLENIKLFRVVNSIPTIFQATESDNSYGGCRTAMRV